MSNFACFHPLKMASTQDELLEGTFYVKEIQKEKKEQERDIKRPSLPGKAKMEKTALGKPSKIC